MGQGLNELFRNADQSEAWSKIAEHDATGRLYRVSIRGRSEITVPPIDQLIAEEVLVGGPETAKRTSGQLVIATEQSVSDRAHRRVPLESTSPLHRPSKNRGPLGSQSWGENRPKEM
jgi:hypothetical protein